MVAALHCVRPQFQWYRLVYATEIKSIQLHDSFKIAVLTFNCHQRSAPPYLCDLVHDYLPRRTLRSGDGVTLEVPRTKTVTAERAFSVAAPTIWNALPLKLRQSKYLNGFKTELKTHLFTTC